MRLHRLLREDVAWLRREDRLGVTMNALILIPFTGPLGLDSVRAQVAAGLHRVPALRRRLLWPPGRVGPPVWADDPRFDLDHHVAPLDAQTVDELRARLPELNRRLDRDRPLWRIWVAPQALVWVFHHALADLAYFDHLAQQLFGAEGGPPEPWTPEPAPGRGRLLLASVPSLVERVVRRLQSVVARPRPQPTVPHPLGTSTGPARRVGSRALALDGLLELKTALAARTGLALTVNDVLLTGLSAGVHAQLHREGSDAAAVRVLVPVDVRSEADAATPGTITRSLVMPLPAGRLDAMARLARVKAAADEVKARPRYAGGEAPCDLTLSNIRMSCTMSVGGARAQRMEMMSMMGRQPLMVIAITMGGTCAVTATVDPEVIAEPGTFLDGFADCLADLRAAVAA